jgi:Na+-driven multidrug efflux pump
MVARYNAMFLIGVAVVFLLLAEHIIGLFSTDTVIVNYGSDALRYISYGYGFFAVGMVLTQAFNGAGDTGTPTVINLVCFWMIQIPLAWNLSHTLGYGPQGVFVSITIAESLVALIAWPWFRRGRWKQRQV